ncbi:hypothetical protein RRG08_049221 [Elysia crispata]|uniref:Uncharacterized protein n=1 Tax=Elysia crispata TaxID=231223 RepID=A0AAE0YUW9_9GAST|nr:hypothetical protein RRG08_049221 [Elysia crispata]
MSTGRIRGGPKFENLRKETANHRAGLIKQTSRPTLLKAAPLRIRHALCMQKWNKGEAANQRQALARSYSEKKPKHISNQSDLFTDHSKTSNKVVKLGNSAANQHSSIQTGGMTDENSLGLENVFVREHL